MLPQRKFTRRINTIIITRRVNRVRRFTKQQKIVFSQPQNTFTCVHLKYAASGSGNRLKVKCMIITLSGRIKIYTRLKKIQITCINFFIWIQLCEHSEKLDSNYLPKAAGGDFLNTRRQGLFKRTFDFLSLGPRRQQHLSHINLMCVAAAGPRGAAASSLKIEALCDIGEASFELLSASYVEISGPLPACALT